MIISMKKAKLVILKEEKELVLKKLQKTGHLMIIKQAQSANTETVSYDGLISRCEGAIKEIARHREKKPLFGDYITINYDAFMKDDEVALSYIKKVELLNEEKLKLNQEIKTLKENIRSYTAWTSLSVMLDIPRKTKYSTSHFGYIEKKHLDTFSNLLKDKNSYLEDVGPFRNMECVFFINFIDDEDEILEKVKNYGFTEVEFPQKHFYMSDLIKELESTINSNRERIKEIDDTIKTFADKMPNLFVYSDQLRAKKQLVEVDYGQTNLLYVIDGWIRSDQIEEFEESIKSVTSAYDVEYVDPLPEEDPPTCTKNNDFVTPFESITNMFSVPNARESDPNPVMSIWYWILFGVMMGDAGYGLCVLILGNIAIKLLHPRGGTLQLFKILMYSSIPTIVWGVFFNSYFGVALPFYKGVISPMTEPVPLLILSVGIGALHILTALVCKAVKDIKNKDPFLMLSKDLSWIFILVGIGLFAAGMFIKIPAMKYVSYASYVLLGLGFAFILLFSGHKKKNIFLKGGAGILGLYDITSYLGDILSYTRIMALVMSSAAVAQVINLLAGMLQGNVVGYAISILVYIGGHFFNIVLGLLSAYVHDCRLQYIEFYGKFYDGGGYEFKPLAINTKYINEIKGIKGEN